MFNVRWWAGYCWIWTSQEEKQKIIICTAGTWRYFNFAVLVVFRKKKKKIIQTPNIGFVNVNDVCLIKMSSNSRTVKTVVQISFYILRVRTPSKIPHLRHLKECFWLCTKTYLHRNVYSIDNPYTHSELNEKFIFWEYSNED